MFQQVNQYSPTCPYCNPKCPHGYPVFPQNGGGGILYWTNTTQGLGTVTAKQAAAEDSQHNPDKRAK